MEDPNDDKYEMHSEQWYDKQPGLYVALTGTKSAIPAIQLNISLVFFTPKTSQDKMTSEFST